MVRLRWLFLLFTPAFLGLCESAFAQKAGVEPSDPASGWLFDEGAGLTAGDSFGINDGVSDPADSAFDPNNDWSSDAPFASAYAGNGSVQFQDGWAQWPGPYDFFNVGPNTDMFDLTNDFTISVWFRGNPDAIPTSGGRFREGVFMARGGAWQRSQFYIATGDTPSIRFYHGGPFTTFDPTDEVWGGKYDGVVEEVIGEDGVTPVKEFDTEWHHTAIRNIAGPNGDAGVAEGESLVSIFFEGDKVAEAVNTEVGQEDNLDITIGARRNGNTNEGSRFPSDFKEDELGYWSEALDDEEIFWLSRVSVSGNRVVGDMDFDRDTDFDDINSFVLGLNNPTDYASAFLMGATVNGDTDGDGDLDFDDIPGFVSALSAAAAGANGVPEPSALLLAVIAAAGLACSWCRRRK